jgi:hypothetical protein
LPGCRRYRPTRESSWVPQRALPLLLRSYGLMRQTKCLSSPWLLTLCHESLQVGVRPCWQMVLPDVISGSLSPGAWTHTPVGAGVRVPVTSSSRIGLLPGITRWAFPHNPAKSDFTAGDVNGAAVIPLCSGTRICWPLRSLSTCVTRSRPKAHSDVSIRAHRRLLPSCVPDMLAVRTGN